MNMDSLQGWTRAPGPRKVSLYTPFAFGQSSPWVEPPKDGSIKTELVAKLDYTPGLQAAGGHLIDSSTACIYALKHGRFQIRDKVSGGKTTIKRMAEEISDIRVCPLSPCFNTDSSKNSTRFLVIGSSGTMSLWELAGQFRDETVHVSCETITKCDKSSADSEDRLHVRWSPVDPFVIACCMSGRIQLLSIQLSQGRSEFVQGKLPSFNHKEHIVCIDFSPDGRFLVAAYAEGLLIHHFAGSESDKYLKHDMTSYAPLSQVIWISDDEILLGSSKNTIVTLYNIATKAGRQIAPATSLATSLLLEYDKEKKLVVMASTQMPSIWIYSPEVKHTIHKKLAKPVSSLSVDRQTSTDLRLNIIAADEAHIVILAPHDLAESDSFVRLRRTHSFDMQTQIKAQNDVSQSDLRMDPSVFKRHGVTTELEKSFQGPVSLKRGGAPTLLPDDTRGSENKRHQQADDTCPKGLRHKLHETQFDGSIKTLSYLKEAIAHQIETGITRLIDIIGPTSSSNTGLDPRRSVEPDCHLNAITAQIDKQAQLLLHIAENQKTEAELLRALQATLMAQESQLQELRRLTQSQAELLQAHVQGCDRYGKDERVDESMQLPQENAQSVPAKKPSSQQAIGYRTAIGLLNNLTLRRSANGSELQHGETISMDTAELNTSFPQRLAQILFSKSQPDLTQYLSMHDTTSLGTRDSPSISQAAILNVIDSLSKLLMDAVNVRLVWMHKAVELLDPKDETISPLVNIVLPKVIARLKARRREFKGYWATIADGIRTQLEVAMTSDADPA